MKKSVYEVPSLIVADVRPENGFAGSPGGDSSPYFDICQGEDDKEFS